MTPEAQRIAISEACGWKLKSNGLSPMWSWQNESLTHRIKWVANKEIASQEVLPDYLNDLNAMHEADNSLTTSQMTTMSQYLHRQLGMLWGFATASQRAEAFLRTIGKWEESR